MLIASMAITPIAGWSVVPALLDPVAIAAGIGVGIASSVIPYVCDQLAMARLSRATYSLMVSILPATATVVGIVVLAQIPSSREVLGVGLVVAAVAVHRERSEQEAAWSTRGWGVRADGLPDLPGDDELRRAGRREWHLREEDARADRAARGRGGRDVLRHRRHVLGRASARRSPDGCCAGSSRAARTTCSPRRSTSRWGRAQRPRAVPQAHHGRDRRLAAAARHRLRRPVPDPPLGRRDADRGDDGGAARRGQGREGAVHRRVQHVRLAVRQGAVHGRSRTAGRDSCRCRTTTTSCTARRSGR